MPVTDRAAVQGTGGAVLETEPGCAVCTSLTAVATRESGSRRANARRELARHVEEAHARLTVGALLEEADLEGTARELVNAVLSLEELDARPAGLLQVFEALERASSIVAQARAEAIVAVLEEAGSTRKAAERLGVSPTIVRKALERVQAVTS